MKLLVCDERYKEGRFSFGGNIPGKSSISAAVVVDTIEKAVVLLAVVPPVFETLIFTFLGE